MSKITVLEVQPLKKLKVRQIPSRWTNCLKPTSRRNATCQNGARKMLLQRGLPLVKNWQEHNDY